jgi:MbtH protein
MNGRVDSGPTHRVVVNDEDQYSVWPAHRELPAGWTAEGTEGDKEVCLARITTVWQDMTPRSLRGRLGRQQSHQETS